MRLVLCSIDFQYVEWAVVITMSIVYVMESSVDEVIEMVTMGDEFVSTIRIMLARTFHRMATGGI